MNNAMQREIMFHLNDPACGIQAIKFVHLNSGKAEVSRKVDSMRTLVMGKVMFFQIGWFFRRERVHGMTHELVKCGFDFFKVFDVGTLVLEDLNNGIE
jgi:hypothetical protein